MHFYGKCWFDLFKEQFISLLSFGQNYFVQRRWNWFSVWLPVTNAWNCYSLYTAFSRNVGAWGMWAYSLFLSFQGKGKLFAYCIDQNLFNLECYFIIYSNQLPFHKVLLQGAILFLGMKSPDCMFLYSMGYWLNLQMIQSPIYKLWRGIQESRPDSTQAVRISTTFCGIAITTIWLSRALSSEAIYLNLWRGYKGHGTGLKHVNRYFNV